MDRVLLQKVNIFLFPIGPQAKSAFQKSESFMPKISPNEAQTMVKLLSQKANIRLGNILI